MALLTRNRLKKLYPLADEDYLVAMVEGKIHVVNYMNMRKSEIDDEFEKVYLPKIRNIFTKYLNSKKRDYFLAEDSVMKKKWLRQIDEIIEEFLKWNKTVFVTSVSEVYNYKRLYNLWMLSTISGAEEDEYDKPVVGESDEGGKKGIIDPMFTKDKLSGLVNKKSYGKTFDDRMDDAYDNASRNLDSSLKGILSGDGKDLNKTLKVVEKGLRKDVSNKAKNAVALGIEDAEDYGDYDVFSANPFFGGNYQRVEVLDKKTCLVCASLDGSVYKEPLYRIHPNCRGIDVPIPEDEEKSKAIKEMSTKSSRRESFNKWFGNLEDKDKKSLLGKTKFEMYKDGKINVHDLVKQNRVMGAKEVKSIEEFKSIPSLQNDVVVAKTVIRNEANKLPQKNITKMKKLSEINAYYRYVNKKEAIYKGLSSSALKKVGINRNTLNAEINRERKVLRLKEKEIRLLDVLSKKGTT